MPACGLVRPSRETWWPFASAPMSDMPSSAHPTTSRGVPRREIPQELTDHNCINLRLPTSGAVYAWEFAKDAHEFTVRVDGQLTLNNIGPALDAALDGVGLAYVPKELVQPYLERGHLQEVLADWCPTFQGYHLYYPSRRNLSPAFSAFVDAFRYRSR